MSTVSLCMIVKNEELVLARCLDSVKDLVEEIVIVDTGSDDRTKEIALGYTNRVFDFAWRDDFAAARNYSLEQATMEYILWLDADDVITLQNRKAFLQLKEQLRGGPDLVMMKYHTAFDSQGRPTFTYYRERLFKRCMGYRFVGAVHEVVVPSGEVVYSDVAVTHQKLGPSDPDRNLRIFEKLLAKGEKLDARQQFYYAWELYYHGRYEEAARELETFLQSGQGWVENEIEACQQLYQCYLALEQPEQALSALFLSFAFDAPRAEICCLLGGHFMERQKLKQAIFWYQLAARRPMEENTGGFVQPDCYGWIPNLQLCVCFDRLGDHQKAMEYNEKAAALKPDDPAVLYNRRYFEQLFAKAE